MHSLGCHFVPKSKRCHGKGGCGETKRKRLNEGKGNEARREKTEELKGAQTCGAGSPVCFAHCPRTLDLPVFVARKMVGQGAEEVKRDRIFPFNKQFLVTYSVLSSMLDLMWAGFKTRILPRRPQMPEGKQKDTTRHRF